MLRRGRSPLAALILVALPAFGCGEAPAASGTLDTAPAPPATVAASKPTGQPSASVSQDADVVLITVDTLRADALGFAGHERAQTPALDRLAAAGRVFSRAFAHNVVTLPSHTNILTGLYPHQHGVRENSGFVLGNDIPTLATLLADAGYATAAFIGAYPLDSRYGLDRGFETYDDTYTAGAKHGQFQFAERSGDRVMAAANAWWDRIGSEAGEGGTQRKRFVWIHLYDPHAPYAAPAPFGLRFADQPYLGEVAAVDAYLGPFLDRVRSVDRPAVIVFTSDHGEGLGDHGEQSHGLFAYNATLKIPLVLWGPGIEPGTDERLAGHVDIVPTVLETLGLQYEGDLAGYSLLRQPDATRTVYFEALSTYFNRGWAPLRGLIDGHEKVISVPLPELYDLAEDPREADNHVDDQRRRYRTLLGALPDEQPWPPGQREVSSEEAQNLRSLGYLATGGHSKTSFGPEDDPKNLIGLDHKLHRMIDAYARGQLDEAGTLARELISARPDMSLGHEHLALVLRAQRRPHEAIAVLEKAINQGVTSDAVVRQLAATLAEIGRPHDAIALLRPLAADQDPATLNLLGSALSEVGAQQEALGMLTGVLEKEPSNAEALEGLGVVYLRLNRLRDAVQMLQKAVSLADNQATSWNSLGVAHAFLGSDRDAIAAWERAVALDPQMLDALFNMGLTAAKIGDRSRARRALERYIDAAPPERFAADIARARQVLDSLSP